MEDREYMTEAEVGERWRLSRSTLYRLRRRRKDPLPHYRFRGRICYRRNEVEQWLKRQKVAQPAGY